MKSLTKLGNDPKWFLELFCHWGHVCANKIDQTTKLNSSPFDSLVSAIPVSAPKYMPLISYFFETLAYGILN
jgi:hypothetical protein